MTQTKVALVINPRAGNGAAKRKTSQILQEFQAHAIEVVNLSSENYAQAQANVDQACQNQEFAAVIVAGGDGMVHLGANLAVTHKLPLGIIGIGSGNDTARALGLPRHNVKAAVQIIAQELQDGAEPEQIDVVQVTRADDSKRYYLGVLSLGLDAEANALANTFSWPRGMLKYLRSLITLLPSHRPYGYTLKLNGQEHQLEANLVAIANSPIFGGGLRIAPQADMRDGQLDLVYTDPLRTREILMVLPKLFRGSHLKHHKVHHQRVTQLSVNTGSTTSPQPPHAFADGEPLGRVPLQIEVLPRALPILGGLGA